MESPIGILGIGGQRTLGFWHEICFFGVRAYLIKVAAVVFRFLKGLVSSVFWLRVSGLANHGNSVNVWRQAIWISAHKSAVILFEPISLFYII